MFYINLLFIIYINKHYLINKRLNLFVYNYIMKSIIQDTHLTFEKIGMVKLTYIYVRHFVILKKRWLHFVSFRKENGKKRHHSKSQPI